MSQLHDCLHQDIPDAEVLLALEPEELAGRLLLILRKDNILNVWHGQAHYTLFGGKNYSVDRQAEFAVAIREAWHWLEAQGLLMPDSNQPASGWCSLSRRAFRIATQQDFTDYRNGRLLHKEFLHPKIAEQVWAEFIRGQFDTAVILAMKAVEVAVRTATPTLPASLYGAGLMWKAFDEKNGPLTDFTVEEGERKGRAQLFAGAIGSYRNPYAHRDVNLDDPHEALEIISLANHLLRIVDARVNANAS